MEWPIKIPYCIGGHLILTDGKTSAQKIEALHMFKLTRHFSRPHFLIPLNPSPHDQVLAEGKDQVLSHVSAHISLAARSFV